MFSLIEYIYFMYFTHIRIFEEHVTSYYINFINLINSCLSLQFTKTVFPLKTFSLFTLNQI